MDRKRIILTGCAIVGLIVAMFVVSYWQSKKSYDKGFLDGQKNVTTEVEQYYGDLVRYLVSDNSCYLTVGNWSCMEFAVMNMVVADSSMTYKFPSDCLNDTVYTKVPFNILTKNSTMWLVRYNNSEPISRVELKITEVE